MSAVSASPALGVEPLDAVRALQHALYRAAKADPGRRFHALYDKVHRRDVLQRAWGQVRRNSGAPGIDQITLAQVEEYGVTRLLDELEAELKAGAYRPLPARRVFIPKPGTDERRPLSIPSVRDRVVQAAAKIVLEPVFEADFLPCSFGFRPKRAAHDGLQVLLDESFRGSYWVVETDVADCFGSIPHSGLMSAVEERISDRRLLALLRAFLRAGVMEQGSVRRPVTGTPQGGVISPLLANVYLHRLDRAWRGAYGTLVRYADDALVMCRSRGQAVAALARLTVLLADLGLEPKAAKTRIVQLRVGGEGVDFLGFHHRLVRSRAGRGAGGFTFLARWPSRKAEQHARDRIRFMTMRARLAAPVEQVV
ncbi:MAG: group II intron reverse transcriptase/maturase, partial [Dermatophilaceae bacterium]